MSDRLWQVAPGVYITEQSEMDWQVAPGVYLSETVEEAPPATFKAAWARNTNTLIGGGVG